MFLADEWKVNDRIKVDAGMRRRRAPESGTISNLMSADTDNNPLTVYNNGTSMPDRLQHLPEPRRQRQLVHRSAATTSWARTTSGVRARQHRPHLHLVRRHAQRRQPGHANDRNGVPTPKVTPVRNRLQDRDPAVQRLHQRLLHEFDGIAFQQIHERPGTATRSAVRAAMAWNSKSRVRPIENLQLTLTGDYQKSEYRDNPAIEGKEVQRQPKLQFRFTPSYRIPLGDNGQAVRYLHLDRRAAGPTRPTCPTCRPIAPSTPACCSRSVTRWEVRLAGTNLTNELGLTEGNSRLTGGPEQRPDQRPSDLRPHLGSIAAVPLLKIVLPHRQGAVSLAFFIFMA
jgi:iron complex outermembrane receptor protein